jgi:hypothetical protein
MRGYGNIDGFLTFGHITSVIMDSSFSFRWSWILALISLNSLMALSRLPFPGLRTIEHYVNIHIKEQ